MDTDDTFEADSTIPIPQMNQADPLGGFQGVPNATFNGVGTGAETLHGDGSVTTRFKNPSTTGTARGVDGGTP